ncbi:hypothetical protein [Actinophytocola sp.]|uniref:hypothetical protein n=1 Tax=Actinophytocola sp. TaxID=1872138 RepID=UPI002D7F706E|nr:hypothetical protein [Actinophytocola sp.]HET9139925.1 hypothetical protein [Actinophytocola sp.]
MNKQGTTEKLIIDTALPSWDVEIAEHLLVHAEPELTWGVARDLNLVTVHTPLLDAAMWVRGLPDRIARRAAAAPPRVTLGGEGDMPGWLLLGERPGREIAAGAVGRFWQPAITWRDVPLAEFPTFAEPGWGKIATAVTTLPFGDGHTLLSYVCRTATTDEAARRRFARYWWLVRPYVGHIMRAVVRTIAVEAERAARSTVDG